MFCFKDPLAVPQASCANQWCAARRFLYNSGYYKRSAGKRFYHDCCSSRSNGVVSSRFSNSSKQSEQGALKGSTPYSGCVWNCLSVSNCNSEVMIFFSAVKRRISLYPSGVASVCGYEVCRKEPTRTKMRIVILFISLVFKCDYMYSLPYQT